jgi:lysophospholipase L1-like esterase
MSGNSEPKSAAPKPRWKRWRQNLALSGTVFFLCVAAFEIGLRFCGYGHLEIYEPDPKLYWKLKPGQDCFTKIGHLPVHINSQGMRGPEFSVAKPADTIRILSLGDSRTFGWGLADEETYSRRLEKLLSAQGGGKKIEVLNAGVSAWSYAQILVYFRDFGLKYQPDYVVLGDANLWTQFSEQNSPEFVRSFMNRVRLKNFLRHFAIYHFVVEVQLQAWYGRERTKFIPIDPKHDQLFKEQQQNDPNAFFRGAVEGVCRVAQTNRIRPILLFLPTVLDLEATNRSDVFEVKRAAGEKLGVLLVDTTADLKPEGKNLYLDADPVHLGAQGNALVAQRLVATFTNILAP